MELCKLGIDSEESISGCRALVECLRRKDLEFETLMLSSEDTASRVLRSFVLLLRGRRIYDAVFARVDITNGV